MNVPQANPALAEIRSLKESAKAQIRENFAIPKSIPSLALVSIEDEAQRNFLLEGLSAIGIAAVALHVDSVPELKHVGAMKRLHPNELYAFDFVVFDGKDENVDLVKCMKSGIVPIVSQKNVFAGILKEFNPMKFEGNAFLFKDDNPFCMFAQSVSYLENVKFPEDRRVLMKNVLSTF